MTHNRRAVSLPIRILLTAFCATAALYLASIGILRSRWFHNIAEQRVTVSLENLTGARVTIGDLEIRPATFQLVLHHLVLHGSESVTQPPLLAAKTVIIRINPLSLLRRRLLISSLYAEGTNVHLVTGRDGAINLPGPKPRVAAAASELTNLSIGALDVVRGSFDWNDQKIPMNISGRRLAMLLYFRKAQGYWGSWSVSSLEVNQPSRAIPPITVASHVELSSRGLALRDLVWRSAGISGRGSANVKWTPDFGVTMILHAHGRLAELARVMHFQMLRSGQFAAQCRVTYSEGRLTAQGTVDARRMLFRTPSFASGRVNLTSDFSASPASIHLSHLRIFSLGGTLRGEGNIRLGSPLPKFSFQLRVAGMDMGEAIRTVPGGKTLASLLALNSKISGGATVAWAGNLENLRSAFDLNFEAPGRLTAGWRPLAGSLRGSAKLAPAPVVTLDQAKLETPHSSLVAHGVLGAPQGSLDVQYSTTDFEESRPVIEYLGGLRTPVPLQLKSTTVFTGVVAGPIRSLEIHGQLNSGAFAFRGWDWQGFSANVDAASNHVHVADGKLRSDLSVFNFQGSASLADWKLEPDSKLSVTAGARRSPLRGLEDALNMHDPVTGMASGQLTLTGTASKLTGKGNFQVVDGSIGGEPFESLSAQAAVANSAWDFREIVLTKGTGKLYGWAHLDWPRRSFSLSFQGRDFSLDQFKCLQRRKREQASALRPAQAAQPASIAGIATFKLQGGGTAENPSIQLNLNISNVKLRGEEAGDVETRLMLQGKEMQAAGTLKGPGGETATVSLTAAADGEWPAKLEGSFAKLRLDPWLERLGKGHWRAPTTASGSFSGTGPLRHPRQLAINAQAQTLTISEPGFTLRSGQTIDVRYRGGSLESNSFRMKGPSTNLTVQASASMLPQPSFSLAVHGRALASVLRLFNPSLDAAGSFNFNVSASGPFDQPSLAGNIGVQNLSLRYAKMPLILAGLNGEIRLKGNQATIVSLKGTSGQSSIQLTGSATIASGVFYDIHARLRHFRLGYPVNFTSLLNGSLVLSGSSHQGELTGHINVEQMFVSENFNMVNWLGQVGSTLGEAPASETSAPASSKIRLDVRMTSNPEVRLTSRSLSFVATIDTTLHGSVADPVATGDIRIQEGQTVIAGNSYQILRGDITLASPFQTTPVLDIEAQTREDRYNVTIDVTGPADRARLAYRSDPPLPTGDILSLLALGYAPQQQLTHSTGNQPFAALGASALLSEAMSSQVSGRVERIFGVSRIRIDPNLMGPATAGGARVTVEEQVAHNLTITYSTNTAAEEQRDIRVTWDLSNKISLIGEQDINGVYGFEIRFHRHLK
ncbi:MAG: translocation/assembly module TamB domain-containing protein [Terriglobia bacterium]